VTQYLIGTGGWAYFNVPASSQLKAYSEIFNFVEVNYTFYEYPDTRMVERWRRTVPKDFTFTVRCHQNLTHKIGLKPTAEAYSVFKHMINICRVLEAPFLHLETPASYSIDDEGAKQAREFFSKIDTKGIGLAWEPRSPITPDAVELMQEFNIVHSVDLSREEPAYKSDVIYTRLFGKGKHNIYQFTDEELEEIDQKILKSEARTVIASYHGVRANADAVRHAEYKKSGTFLPVTQYTGVDSAEAVLQEDANFPSSKAELIEHQGWKVIDLTTQKRVHLSELLAKIPEKTYHNLNEIAQALKVHYG
jgi:uncharacterized protein YecE (DUF72 family)